MLHETFKESGVFYIGVRRKVGHHKEPGVFYTGVRQKVSPYFWWASSSYLKAMKLSRKELTIKADFICEQVRVLYNLLNC